MATKVTADHGNMDEYDDHDDASILYESALTALMSSEHQAITKDAIEKTSQRRTQTVNDMHIYMQRIGLLNENLQPIESSNTNDDDGTVSVIHVAGTKGKGSVCAMCEVMMRRNDPNTVTGLFTSPHLVDVRERIRINGLPISQRIFGQAYWFVRKRLEQHKKINDDDELPILPGYFRMITLLALFIFKNYRSDDATKRRITCVVLEVGMGGRYDATNVRLPWTNTTTVCGITLIDYDHVRVLGHTLPAIAWEKGGIYAVKKGHCNDDQNNDNHRTPHPTREQEHYMKAIANVTSNVNVSSQQKQSPRRCFALDTNKESVIDVFRLCAMYEGQGDDLVLAGPSHSPQLPSRQYELGLKGSHQYDNAELAIVLCQAIINQKENTNTETKDSKIYEALSDMTWPGRCQTLMYTHPDAAQKTNDIPITIRLDGAHTIQSIRAGLEWYNTVTNTAMSDDATSTCCCHILVFNCSHERNPVELLDMLYNNSKTRFHAVYFCRADSERPSAITKSSTIELWQASHKNDMTDPEIIRSFLRDTPNDTPTWQDTLLGIWNLLELTSNTVSYKAIDRASNLPCTDAIQRGCQFVRTRTNEFTSMEIFCTGSLYLVGSMLTAIQWQEEEATGTLITA